MHCFKTMQKLQIALQKSVPASLSLEESSIGAVRKLCDAVAGLHFEFKIQDGYVVEMQFKWWSQLAPKLQTWHLSWHLSISNEFVEIYQCFLMETWGFLPNPQTAMLNSVTNIGPKWIHCRFAPSEVPAHSQAIALDSTLWAWWIRIQGFSIEQFGENPERRKNGSSMGMIHK